MAKNVRDLVKARVSSRSRGSSSDSPPPDDRTVTAEERKYYSDAGKRKEFGDELNADPSAQDDKFRTLKKIYDSAANPTSRSRNDVDKRGDGTLRDILDGGKVDDGDTRTYSVRDGAGQRQVQDFDPNASAGNRVLQELRNFFGTAPNTVHEYVPSDSPWGSVEGRPSQEGDVQQFTTFGQVEDSSNPGYYPKRGVQDGAWQRGNEGYTAAADRADREYMIEKGIPTEDIWGALARLLTGRDTPTPSDRKNVRAPIGGNPDKDWGTFPNLLRKAN